jgi:hypothetical protein
MLSTGFQMVCDRSASTAPCGGDGGLMAAAYELLDKPRFQTEWGHSTWGAEGLACLGGRWMGER